MSEEAIDVVEFLERVQDDKELLLELLDIFIEDFQEKRKLLGEAIGQQDFESIRSISHSVKGASGNISAKPIRALFIKVEEMGKNNDLTGADELLSTIDVEFTALTDRISNLKTELK